MNAIKTLKVNETATIGGFIVKKTARNEFRLGEVMGDWIMSGSMSEILDRIEQG